MKVNATNNSQRVTVKDVRDTQKTGEPKPGKVPESSTQFQPSHAQDTSRDIDTARVNAVRQAITEGKLELHADRIADGIINSARELIADQ